MSEWWTRRLSLEVLLAAACIVAHYFSSWGLSIFEGSQSLADVRTWLEVGAPSIWAGLTWYAGLGALRLLFWAVRVQLRRRRQPAADRSV